MRKVVSTILFLFLATLVNGQDRNKSDSLVFLLRSDGFYSFHDTTKDNESIPYFKKYKYITPFIFNKNGTVQQFPFSTNDSRYLQNGYKNQIKADSGKFFIKGHEIIVEGYFTFYSWGMRFKKYRATYQGIISNDGLTILIKIIPPYPKINMRLNNHLKSDIEGKRYSFKL